MQIDLFTIFPEAADAWLEVGLIGKARENGHLNLQAHDLRMATSDAHRTVDDAPFGGGPGMVMMCEPVFAAVEAVKPQHPLFVLSPGGRPLDQAWAAELASGSGFSLICGRYEGMDQRIVDHLADGEMSVGNFVLAGGEAAAFCAVEAVARLVPGVLGNQLSPTEETFADGLLEYPQYTRPADFRGWGVPEVLRGGDHAKVEAWRQAAALARTIENRPDLIEARGGLTAAEVETLEIQGYSVPSHLLGD